VTPLKLTAGCTAIFSLLFVFAVKRIPEAPAAIPSESFENAWADIMIQPLPKSDRLIISTASKPVEILRVMPDVPADVPPVLAPIREDKPKLVHRRHVERNICTRHGKRKVTTRNGRSWRCR
jgi:hypothetical protein